MSLPKTTFDMLLQATLFCQSAFKAPPAGPFNTKLLEEFLFDKFGMTTHKALKKIVFIHPFTYLGEVKKYDYDKLGNCSLTTNMS